MKTPSHSFVHSLVLLSTLLHLATSAHSSLSLNQLGPENNNDTSDPSLASLSSVPDHHSLEEQSDKKKNAFSDSQLHPKDDDRYKEEQPNPLLDQPSPLTTTSSLGLGLDPVPTDKPNNLTADPTDNHPHNNDPPTQHDTSNTTGTPSVPASQHKPNHTTPPTPPTPSTPEHSSNNNTNTNNPPPVSHLGDTNTTEAHPTPSPHPTPNTTVEPLNLTNPNPNPSPSPSPSPSPAPHTIDQVNASLVSAPPKSSNKPSNNSADSLVHIGVLNSTLVSAPFQDNHTAAPPRIGELNSTLASSPFHFHKPTDNNTASLTPDHIGDLNSTLVSNPFQVKNPANKTGDAVPLHIGDLNSTLVSHPFQFKKPPNSTADNNSFHIGDLNSTLVSNPFQVKKPSNNSVGVNPIRFGDLNSTLISRPFQFTKPNNTVDASPSHIGDLNSTLVSSPFQVNKPSNHSASVVQVGDLNSTLVSNPFRFNTPSNSTGDVTPVHIGDLNSTLVSSPFQVNKPSNNSVDINSVHIGDLNSTLVSNPFKYVSSNSTGNHSSISIGDLNSTLISTPFKFNPSNSSGSTISPPSDFNSSALPSSLLDHTNLTIASSPFHVNSSHFNSSSSLLDSLVANSNQSSIPPNLGNTTAVRTSDVFSLPSTNNSLSANNSLSTTNSTLQAGLLPSNTTDNNNSTSLNSSPTSPTPYHHNESKPAPAFVPTGSLFTNPRPNESKGQPKPSNPVETSLPSAQTPPNKATPAPFPSSWPRYIVPSNTPTSPPANSTLISILFTDALNWPWMVTNSNASSQVLVFMPTLIAYSLQISEDQVVTQSLQAYQPANFNSNDEASMLTLWLGYIPSQYVSELQAMIRAPQSRFYSNPNPVLRTLAKTVDPTLPITTYEKKTPASQAGANATNAEDENPPAVNSGQKIAVIASVTTCGAAILAIGLVIAARQSQRRVANGTRRAISPEHGNGGMRIGAPMIGTFHRGSDGAPVPIYRPPMEQVSAVPFNGSVGHQNEHSDGFLTNSQNSRSPVRYEYGEARTTSMIHDPFQPTNDQRKSWWSRLSLGLAGGGGLNRSESNGYGPLHWENNPPPNLESPNDLSHPRLSNVQNPNLLQSSPPRNNRRLPITRGADGLVSGIGRPVMKENSLFF